VVQEWQQIGEDAVLQEKYGKRFVQRRLVNPRTEKEDDFYLYGRRNGAIVFPVTEDGKVIVVKQFRQGIMGITFELPAGIARTGEDMVLAVRRELLEETGYEPGELFQTRNGVCLDATSSWTKDQTFLAFGCRRVGEAADNPRESIELVLMSFEEWMAHVFVGGEPMDSGSVAATLYAIPFLLRRGLITSNTLQ